MLQRLGQLVKHTYKRYKPRYSLAEAKHIFRDAPVQPLLVCDFRDAHWQLLCDRDVGGFSTASFTVQNGVGVFEGVLDTRPNPELANMRKSGYAAIKSPDFEPLLDLSGYSGLEFKIRTDASIYVAQLKTARLSEDDLYQAVLPISDTRAEYPLTAESVSRAVAWEHADYKAALAQRVTQRREAETGARTETRTVAPEPSEAPAPRSSVAQLGPWRHVYVPFDSYVLTWRGYVELTELHARVRQQQGQRSDSAVDLQRIASLGLLMAQRRSGPFRLEIEWIRAVTPQMIAPAVEHVQRYTADH